MARREIAECFAAACLVAWAIAALGRVRAQNVDQPVTDPVGIFEGHGDVGTVLHAGSVGYDAATKTYRIAGSGENMWLGSDAFHFVWKRANANVTLTADIAFTGAGKNPHRKAVLMIRQSLDSDAVYADVAVHGNGLTSLQYRDEKGAMTQEVQAMAEAPKRVRIVKHKDYFSMWVAGEDGKFALAGATGKIVLKEPFYVGIGVCSHEKELVEKAVFSNVQEEESADFGAVGLNGEKVAKLASMLEIVDVDSKERKAIYVAEERFEAPNWMPDGKTLLFNRNGRIEKISVTGGVPEVLDTGFATRCNNDHLISPDGTQLGISDNSQEEHKALVYLLPITGGTPRRITEKSPSYLHGWSPDGKTLAFVGERNGDFDIYTIPADGGQETRLTTAKGLDDGPEYTRDGKYIYFNSERTGHMQIWRMRADGGEQEQVTFGEENDWFPHISPSGEWMVFLSYDKSVSGHPENKDVILRLMSLRDKKITVLAKLFGGQGTINVPSWSPDGSRLAFVSYALVANE